MSEIKLFNKKKMTKEISEYLATNNKIEKIELVLFKKLNAPNHSPKYYFFYVFNPSMNFSTDHNYVSIIIYNINGKLKREFSRRSLANSIVRLAVAYYNSKITAHIFYVLSSVQRLASESGYVLGHYKANNAVDKYLGDVYDSDE